MNEMIERAARATWLVGRDWDARDSFDAVPDYGQDLQRDIARAALLAALDPEDEAMVERWARAHWNGSPEQREDYTPSTSSTRRFERVYSPVLWDDADMREIDREATRRGVRAAIAALRAHAQGETKP